MPLYEARMAQIVPVDHTMHAGFAYEVLLMRMLMCICKRSTVQWHLLLVCNIHAT